jgi:RND superfamily putative drug exporter
MLPTSKLDPGYAALYRAVATADAALTGRNPVTGAVVRSGYDGLDSALATAAQSAHKGSTKLSTTVGQSGSLVAGLRRLATGAGSLRAGLLSAQAGAQQLEGGMTRLSGGTYSLHSGADALSVGAGQLAGGLGRLHGGSGQLSTGLANGASRAGSFASDISQSRGQVGAFSSRAAGLARSLGSPRLLAPILASGYTTIAAINSAGPAARAAAGFVINITRGGNAANLVVVSGQDPAGLVGRELSARLHQQASRFARETNTSVAIGGPAAELQDYQRALGNRIWILILGLVLVAYVLLVPVLRSIVLPAIVVLLNVMSVIAAFGVLTLGFVGHSPPLGGPGWIDGISAIGIFTVAFALSIDYSVFLLSRVRERFESTGDATEAISFGLQRTAGIITGAALIMTGVFLAFAVSGVITLRENGVGLTVAVLLDATAIRLILLPACLRLAGPRVWYYPRLLSSLFGPTQPPGASPLAHVAGQRAVPPIEAH